jgi:hypothetical protein
MPQVSWLFARYEVLLHGLCVIQYFLVYLYKFLILNRTYICVRSGWIFTILGRYMSVTSFYWCIGTVILRSITVFGRDLVRCPLTHFAMVGTSFDVTNFINLLFDVLASLTDFIYYTFFYRPLSFTHGLFQENNNIFPYSHTCLKWCYYLLLLLFPFPFYFIFPHIYLKQVWESSIYFHFIYLAPHMSETSMGIYLFSLSLSCLTNVRNKYGNLFVFIFIILPHTWSNEYGENKRKEK